MMKKILINPISVVVLILGIVIILEVKFYSQKSYSKDISEVLAENQVKVNELNTYENISINNRDYTKVSFFVDEDGYVRIAELKTEESELYIPSKIGDYPVLYIGAQYFELPEVVEYIEENGNTPLLGQHSWMEEKNKKFDKVVIEEGVRSIFKEAFRGIKTKVLELPESIEPQSSTVYDEAEIDEIVRKKGESVNKYNTKEYDNANVKLELNLPLNDVQTYNNSKSEIQKDEMGNEDYKIENGKILLNNFCKPTIINAKGVDTFVLNQPIKFQDYNKDTYGDGIVPEYNSFFVGCPDVVKVQMDEGGKKQPRNGEIYAENNMIMCMNPRKGIYACPITVDGKIKISDGICDIYDCAFNGCNRIKEVKISSSVRWVGDAAFGNMKGCKRIDVSKESKYLKSKDGVLYTKDGEVLIAYPAGKKEKEFKVPESVRMIVAGAFMGAGNLEKIKLSDNMYYIGEKTFMDCVNLKKINSDNKVTYIMNSAYEGCKRLIFSKRPKRVNYEVETYIEAYIDWKNKYKYLSYLEKAKVYKIKYKYQGNSIYYQ